MQVGGIYVLQGRSELMRVILTFKVTCYRRVMAIPMNAENTETLAWSDA